MSSPVGYPQRNAYPMFSSTSQGDVPVGKNGTNLIPVMASISSSGGVDYVAFARSMRQPCVLATLNADAIGIAQTAIQKLHAVKIPAGTLSVGDTIKITVSAVKSGSADTATGKLTAGPLNTSSDSTLLGGPGMAGTATSVGSTLEYKVNSLTSLRGVGAVHPNSALSGSSAGAVWPDAPIGDIATQDLWIGMYYTMTAGSEVPTLRNFIVELIPAV